MQRKISRPVSNEFPVWQDLLQARLQARAGKWISQVFPNNNIRRIMEQFGKKLPARRLRLKIISSATAMLHEDHFAGLSMDLASELIDARYHAVQVMLGFTIEHPNLHVDDQQCVHRVRPNRSAA